MKLIQLSKNKELGTILYSVENKKQKQEENKVKEKVNKTKEEKE